MRDWMIFYAVMHKLLNGDLQVDNTSKDPPFFIYSENPVNPDIVNPETPPSRRILWQRLSLI